MTKHEVNDARETLGKALPLLAMQIFALAGREYLGCGLHYVLVRDVGGLLRLCNDYDRVMSREDLIVVQMVYHELRQQVARAEASARAAEFATAATVASKPVASSTVVRVACTLIGDQPAP